MALNTPEEEMQNLKALKFMQDLDEKDLLQLFSHHLLELNAKYINDGVNCRHVC